MEFQPVLEVFAVDRFDSHGSGINGLIETVWEQDFKAEFNAGKFPFGPDPNSPSGEVAAACSLNSSSLHPVEDLQDGNPDARSMDESGISSAIVFGFGHSPIPGEANIRSMEGMRGDRFPS